MHSGWGDVICVGVIWGWVWGCGVELGDVGWDDIRWGGVGRSDVG